MPDPAIQPAPDAPESIPALSSTRNASSSPIRWFTLLLLFAAAITLRLKFLASKPFWSDECFSVEIAWIDWRNFFHLMWWREANMSLYYVLLRMWLHFGHSQFFIRSLSVLFAAAMLPAIYWLANLLYDRRVATIATALLTFNAYHVRYSQEARSYTLFALLATLSSGFMIAWLRNPERRYRIAYIVVSALAVYAHFYALLLLAVHLLVLRWLGSPTDTASEGKHKVSPDLKRAWMTIGIAVVPLLAFVAKTGAGPIKWIHRPGIRDLLLFFEHYSGGAIGWSGVLLAVVFAAAFIAGASPGEKKLLARDQGWKTWRVQFLVTWFLFPVVLTVVLSFARPVFLDRYMLFCLPALLVLVAAGLARIRRSWLLGVSLALILICTVPGIFFIYGNDYDNDRDGAGEATDFVLNYSQLGDGVIFYIPATRIPYEFFRSQHAGENTASPNFTAPYGPKILFPNHGPGLDYRDFTGKPNADILRAASSTYPRVWVMLMNNQPAWSTDPTTAMLTQILSGQFSNVERWQFPKVELRLYSK